MKIPGKGAIFALIVVAALIGVYYFGFANDTGTVELTVTKTAYPYGTAFPVGSTWYINLAEPIDIAVQMTVIGTWGLTDMGVDLTSGEAGASMYYSSSNYADGLENDFAITGLGLNPTSNCILVDYDTGHGLKLFVLYQNAP